MLCSRLKSYIVLVGESTVVLIATRV